MTDFARRPGTPWHSLATGAALTLVVTAAALAVRSGVAAADDDSASSTAGKARVIEAQRNLRQFSPPETSVAVDAETTSIRQVLTDLGPDAIAWYQHVQTLSNPYFEGRVPGSAGMDRAADYVEFWYRQAGLEPAFPDEGVASPDWTSYRQPMELPGRGLDIALAEATVAGGALNPGEDFIVLGSSGTGVIEAPLVFVGYGIEEGRDGYSSFDAGTDLAGRVAVLLRYEPMDEEGQSRWSDRRFSEFAAIRPKLEALAKRNAAGVILVNPPGSKHGRQGLDTTETTQFGGSFPMPMIQLDQDTADTLLREADPQRRSLMDWRRLADTGAVRTAMLSPDVRVRLAADVSPRVTRTANIGGVLRGKGSLADEWIVIGGHYDHVGMGLFGTDPRNRGQLHPGADDNASSTAAVIMLAEHLSKAYADLPEDGAARSILFLAFTAEESGLEGSRHYVRNPTIPADRINLMINLDMVGRLRDNTLSMGGLGTAEDMREILDPHFASSGITIAADPSGRGPSDHASFYGAGVPVLFAFTGLHAEYHAPTDTAETVNPAGAARIIGLMRSIAFDIATRPDRLAFTSSDTGPGADRGYASVRLGVTPGMGGEEQGEGVLVEAVADDTTASDAGIEPGDILVAWNGEGLTGAGSLMERLREHKPGDVVQIVLLRNGQRMVVTATMKASTGRR